MVKKATSKSTKQLKRLSGSHRLIIRTLGMFKRHFKPIAKVAIVAALINILLQFLLTPEISSLYQGLWFLFASCALIWTMRHVEDKQIKLNLRGAYYDGTSAVLKFFLVSCVIALATLPFSLGTFVFLTVSRLALGSLTAPIIAGIAWALLSALSIWLLSRWIFALPIVTLPALRPIESLRLSWALTKGRVRQLIVRLGIVLIYLLILAVIFVVLVSLVSLSSTLGLMVLGLLSNALLIPFFYGYLFQLYQELT